MEMSSSSHCLGSFFKSGFDAYWDSISSRRESGIESSDGGGRLPNFKSDAIKRLGCGVDKKLCVEVSHRNFLSLQPVFDRQESESRQGSEKSTAKTLKPYPFKLPPRQTPAQLLMEDDDIIETVMEQASRAGPNDVA
ncbi:hypothetical protein Bca52824_015635 [Brassica carinata]|uniref:Uncharacterized protein n=1 Tax=Brassica carinata TaxID=52824 RepID=A0A8X8B5U5_BRACI|nr:hypothetical protein Bca52824_015635 [Brassica carinata]